MNISIINLPGSLSKKWYDLGDKLNNQILGPTSKHFALPDQDRYEADNWRSILMVRYMHASSRELTVSAQSGHYSPAESRFFLDWGNERNLNEQDAYVVDSAIAGFAMIAELAAPTPPTIAISKVASRAGSGIRRASTPPRSFPTGGGSCAVAARTTPPRNAARSEPFFQFGKVLLDFYGAGGLSVQCISVSTAINENSISPPNMPLRTFTLTAHLLYAKLSSCPLPL